ncbi:hypothetical protein [Halpernia sp.]|uniref:hypothetical protein n=1 Tax=Halpernia sp. TaxID=2782209 RepID=UPI003A91C9F6
MKKLLVVAFLGALTLSACSKKTENTESNTMMEEPDSTTIKSDSKPTDGAVKMDSTAMKPMKSDSTMSK